VQLRPHARLLPLVQAAPASGARAEAELEWQVPPGDPRMQHEEDPLQRLPIRQPLAARVAKPPLCPWQQRLDQHPQLVRDDPRRGSHRHPSQLDDRCRRRSSSRNGSLHFDSTSKGVAFGAATAPVFQLGAVTKSTRSRDRGGPAAPVHSFGCAKQTSALSSVRSSASTTSGQGRRLSSAPRSRGSTRSRSCRPGPASR
jgi:hypothetical protein